MGFDAGKMAKQLREHLVKDILPFWRKYALDREMGGYHSELFVDGQPGRRRRKCLAMQARMVDAFVAGAQFSGESAYLECARHGVEFILGTMYRPKDQKWICGVERDGTPAEERMRVFDLAAVVQALTSYASAAKDLRASDLIKKTYEQLDGHFWDKRFGGYYERIGSNWEVDSDIKSTDAQLHMIEALMELAADSHDEEHEVALRKCLALLIHKTQGEDFLPLFEVYAADWEEYSGGPPRVKYGHCLKAAWLYFGAYRQFQKQAYLDFARWQLEYALHIGAHPSAGIYSSGNANGEILNTHHSWWAQCEAIAALARVWAIQRGEEDARQLARYAEYCLECFHDKEHGEWFAVINPQNEVVDDRKAHETKCAYPIVRCLAAAVEDLERA